MSNHENLTAALLAAFNLDADKADPAVIAGAAARVLAAFAEIVRGPAPVAGELASTELVVDETPALILAELRALRSDASAHMRSLLEARMCGAARIAGDLVDALATGGAASGLPG